MFEENSSFLDTGTCPLHTINNEFCKGIGVTDFDMEQFSQCSQIGLLKLEEVMSFHHIFSETLVYSLVYNEKGYRLKFKTMGKCN